MKLISTLYTLRFIIVSNAAAMNALMNVRNRIAVITVFSFRSFRTTFDETFSSDKLSNYTSALSAIPCNYAKFYLNCNSFSSILHQSLANVLVFSENIASLNDRTAF